MELSREEIERVRLWLDSRGVHGACPACGANDWGVGNPVLLPVEPTLGMLRAGEHVPTISSVCKICGFVRLFSAKMMGVW